MTATELPGWVLALTTLLSLAGATVTLIGALGLIRLRTFYERVHAPTLGATLGMALLLAGSFIFFTALEQRFMPRELLIGVFFTVTTPVTLIILARAALFRDRTDRAGDGNPVPPEDAYDDLNEQA